VLHDWEDADGILDGGWLQGLLVMPHKRGETSFRFTALSR
jgi:hypothetical protein